MAIESEPMKVDAMGFRMPLIATEFETIDGGRPPFPDYNEIFVFDVSFKANNRSFEINLGTRNNSNGRAGFDFGMYKRDAQGGLDTLEAAIARIQAEDQRGSSNRPRPPHRVVGAKTDERVNTPGPRGRKPTGMSFLGKRNCFILLRFDPRSNLRFTMDYAAISRDADLSDGIFTHGHRVHRNGQIFGEPKTGDISTHSFADGCNAAVFAYHHDRVSNLPEFEGRLNLHLDVLEDPSDPDSPYIPIIIDPDVRFPGGNGGG